MGHNTRGNAGNSLGGLGGLVRSWYRSSFCMSESAFKDAPAQVDRIYRAGSGRILATLIRLLGDFDLAEDRIQPGFSPQRLH